MGLTPFDVQNLNQSIAGVGNAFERRRAEQSQDERDALEKTLRQKQLEIEQRRLTAEEGRQNILASGHVDQWLQTEDEKGPQYTHYIGPPQGMQKIMEGSKANGAEMRLVPPPAVKPAVAVKVQHPDGSEVTAQLRDTADVAKFHSEMSKAGFGVQKNQPTAREVQIDKAAAALESQADDLDEQSLDAGGVDAAMMRTQSKGLRDRAKGLRQSIQKAEKPDPTDYENITQKVRDPSDPNNLHDTETTHSYKVKRGEGAPAVTVPSSATPMPAVNGVPTVKTKADFDKLPKGTKFLWTDGKTYSKP